MRKTEIIEELLDIVPWLTPELVAKHIESDVWVNDKDYAYVKAYNMLLSLEKQGRIIVASSERKIYRKKGRDRRVGMFYFHHNQAVISILINCYLGGYDVQYAGVKNCDGMISKLLSNTRGSWKESIALEVDRGNHTKNSDLANQIMKYDNVDKILFVSFPKYAISDSEKNQELQFVEMNKLRKKIQELNLPKSKTNKLYFATYVEASNPTVDPLGERVWKTLNGKNISVL